MPLPVLQGQLGLQSQILWSSVFQLYRECYKWQNTGVVPRGYFIPCSNHEGTMALLRADVESAAYCGKVGAE